MTIKPHMKKIYQTDPWLQPFKDAIDARHENILKTLEHIAGNGKLKDAVNNHMYYGLHRTKTDYCKTKS